MSKLIKTEFRIVRWYTICNNCPCLNNDYEQGESCNLGYTTDYVELKIKGYAHVSTNCKLSHIKHGDSSYSPCDTTDCEIIKTYELSETRQTLDNLLLDIYSKRYPNPYIKSNMKDSNKKGD